MTHPGVGWREEPLSKGTLGACDLGSSCNHLSSFIYYTFKTKILSITLRGINTRLWNRKLEIKVTRSESRDLDIATTSGLIEVMLSKLSVPPASTTQSREN